VSHVVSERKSRSSIIRRAAVCAGTKELTDGDFCACSSSLAMMKAAFELLFGARPHGACTSAAIDARSNMPRGRLSGRRFSPSFAGLLSIRRGRISGRHAIFRWRTVSRSSCAAKLLNAKRGKLPTPSSRGCPTGRVAHDPFTALKLGPIDSTRNCSGCLRSKRISHPSSAISKS